MRISDWSSDVCSSDLASVDRKRQSSGEIVFILVSPPRDDVAVNAFALVSEQRDAAPDAFTERPRNRPAGGALLIIADSEKRSASGTISRSEEHTSELQSLMRISYAVFCLKKTKKNYNKANDEQPKNTKQKHIVAK